MAYEIHLILDKKGHKHLEYLLNFPEDIHQELFNPTVFKSDGFSSFNRMADYYKDSHFKTNELEGLIQNLNVLISEYYETPKIADVLCELKRGCKKAIKLKADLVTYCD